MYVVLPPTASALPSRAKPPSLGIKITKVHVPYLTLPLVRDESFFELRLVDSATNGGHDRRSSIRS